MVAPLDTRHAGADGVGCFDIPCGVFLALSLERTFGHPEAYFHTSCGAIAPHAKAPGYRHRYPDAHPDSAGDFYGAANRDAEKYADS